MVNSIGIMVGAVPSLGPLGIVMTTLPLLMGQESATDLKLEEIKNMLNDIDYKLDKYQAQNMA